MEEEIWRDVKGYEGLYQASSLGRVKSLDRVTEQTLPTGKSVWRHYEGKLLSCTLDKGTGYNCVSLQKDGHSQYFLVHRLVAQTFIPNPDNLPQVNHIDEDKTNNYVSNLEWCTNSYNVNYGSRNAQVSKALKGRKCSPEWVERNRQSHIGKTAWNKGLQTILVLCLDEGIEFAGSRDAGEWLGVTSSAIEYACKHIACCKGHVFVYAKDAPEDTVEYVYTCYKHSGRYRELEAKWLDKFTSAHKDDRF